MTETATSPEAPARKGSLVGQGLIFLAAAALSAFVVAQYASHRGEPDLPVVAEVPSFELTDRKGEAFRREDLLGEVWVVGFIFTRCSGPCPRLSGEMARLHGEPALAGLHLLSLTVDPEYDSPEVLTDYARNFGADPARWRFVTGPRGPLYELITKGFKLPAQEAPAEANMPVGESFGHSSRLVLVDREGRIRGYFESQDPVRVRELEAAAARLLDAPRYDATKGARGGAR